MQKRFVSYGAQKSKYVIRHQLLDAASDLWKLPVVQSELIPPRDELLQALDAFKPRVLELCETSHCWSESSLTVRGVELVWQGNSIITIKFTGTYIAELATLPIKVADVSGNYPGGFPVETIRRVQELSRQAILYSEGWHQEAVGKPHTEIDILYPVSRPLEGQSTEPAKQEALVSAH